MARVRLGRVAVSALVLSAGFAMPVRAGDSGPICRVPSVVDVMRRELHRRDHYAHIERQWIKEYPGLSLNVVLCGVSALTLRYDAASSDDVPLRYVTSHEFRVLALPDGYVVKFVR